MSTPPRPRASALPPGHWLDAPISCAANVKIVNGLQTTTIRKEQDAVRRADRVAVDNVRCDSAMELICTGDPEAAKKKANEAKKKLPYITPAGGFSKRNNESLIRHSGIVMLDLDGLADVEGTKARLAACPRVGSVFLSVTGTGLRVFVPVTPIPTNAAEHKAAYHTAVRVIETAGGVKITDHAGEDVSRASFISSDPTIHINEAAIPVHWKLAAAVTGGSNGNGSGGNGTHSAALKRRVEIARGLLSHLEMQQDGVTGFCECPGISDHTNGDGARDCRVKLDGTPTISCFHKSCRCAVDEANHELRSAIGKDEDHTGDFDDLTGDDLQALGDAEAKGGTVKGTEAADLAAMLAAVRFDIGNPPPDPPPVFKLDGHSIATAGNLVAIQAQAKAGKTAFIGATLAATMKPTGDCLGVWSENPRGFAVLHFDTEQTPADHHRVIKCALARAGRTEPPPWLRSYCLTGMKLKARNAAMRFELERAAMECGGIHSVFLDGLADFAVDPNDTTEALALIDELHRLAIHYSAPFLCVLHENPGTEHGKTRGHLGSQLERKAETNLRLSKDGEGITVVYAERARHAHIPKDKGPRFAWSAEAGMHLTTETKSAAKESARAMGHRAFAEEIFRGIPSPAGLTWGEMHRRIEEIGDLTKEGARKRFAAMLKAEAIRKDNLGNYHLNELPTSYVLPTSF